ncbi:hypothetical protein HJG60_011579 [Phyllostomus discolor]|uniref:Uncharacterized protein n=1 Tax=Phyllostomus discolor TaxID=89673 RepID=A0A833ZVI8_9CHIR|nr:hypothetical protein HJG60_011579 [Phyllostomus discolor]
METSDPAPHRVEWGRQGLDPGHLLSPPIPRPAPGRTASPAPQGAVGRPWAGRGAGSHGTSVQGLQSRSPANEWTPGEGPQGAARAHVSRFQGATSGAAGRGFCSRAPALTSCLATPPTLEEMHVCASAPAPAPRGQRQASSPRPPGPATARPWLVSGIVVPAGPRSWWWGACDIVGERTPWSGPEVRVGSRGWGSPSLCPALAPREASTNRSPFFVVI